MSVGRKPNAIPRIPWKVMVRADLAAEVELIITDPMREKPKYGARTQLLEMLLERYLKEVRLQQKPPPVPTPPPVAYPPESD